MTNKEKFDTLNEAIFKLREDWSLPFWQLPPDERLNRKIELVDNVGSVNC